MLSTLPPHDGCSGLFRDLLSGWSPKRHNLFGPQFRQKVWCCLLIHHRQSRRPQLHTGHCLATQTWFNILSFLDGHVRSTRAFDGLLHGRPTVA